MREPKGSDSSRGSRGCARRAALVLAVLGLVSPVAAAEIEGVVFADESRVSTTRLSLSGVGLLRYRVLFKGYVAALYLPDDASPEQALEDIPRRLEIEYFWSISAEDFRDATVEGMARNPDPTTLSRFETEIGQINAMYGDVAPGDRYALSYLPGRGTELALNGEPQGVIPGAAFSAALFAIWIGESALDDSLRDQLLSVK